MAQMPEKRPTRTAAPPSNDRLVVLYTVSTVMILIAVFALTVYTTNQMRAQSRVIGQQTEAIEALRGQVDQYRDALLEIKQVLESGPARTAAPAQAPSTEPAALTDVEIAAQLGEIAPRSGNGERSMNDPEAADALLARIDVSDGEAFRTQTWEELALLSVLRGDGKRADQLMRHGGVGTVEYLRARAQLALRSDAPRDAVVAARMLVRSENTPRNKALLATAELRSGLRNDAISKLESAPRTTGWPAIERLQLANTFASLHRWSAVEQVLSNWKPSDATQLRQTNLLRARAAIFNDESVIALAIVDELLADSPTDANLLLLRGAALVQGGQPTAAAEVLGRDDLPSADPQTWYWRGRLALLQDDAPAARGHLERAVATDRYYAPAWEALAATMLNGDDAQSALRYVDDALKAAPQRASAHLLQAMIQTRLGNDDAARSALATALQLQPALRATAIKSEALAALLDGAGE